MSHIDIPGPDEHPEQVEMLKEYRDRQIDVLAASTGEDADDILADVRDFHAGETVEVDVGDLLRLLGDVELHLAQPAEPFEHLHRLDVLARITEFNQDAIQSYVQELVEDTDETRGPSGMFQ